MMHLVVRSGKFEVWATVETRENFGMKCPATDFLQSCWANYESSVKGYNALFSRYATEGRTAFTSAQLHEVNKKDSLYEIIKGDLRLMCFFHLGNMVLTNGLIKKSQKADTLSVNECRRSKEIFLLK